MISSIKTFWIAAFNIHEFLEPGLVWCPSTSRHVPPEAPGAPDSVPCKMDHQDAEG